MSRYIAVDSILARWYRTSVRGRTEFDQVIANIPSIDLEADYVPRDYYEKVVSEMAKRNVEAADIVFCKECDMSEVYQNDSSGVMARYCRAFAPNRMVADDDFCSYGERSDNE